MVVQINTWSFTVFTGGCTTISHEFECHCQHHLMHCLLFAPAFRHLIQMYKSYQISLPTYVISVCLDRLFKLQTSAIRMSRTTPSTLIVALLLGGALAQPKPDDPSCIQGNQKRIPECCRMPFLVDQNIMNRCVAENPMTALPAPGVPRTEGCVKRFEPSWKSIILILSLIWFQCIAQCILTTLNAFKDNAIDKEAAKRATAQTLGTDPIFTPLVDGFVDECFKLVNNNATFTATPVSSTPGRPGCSFVPEGFINCVKSKLFQQCPAAAWTSSADCDQLKQKISAGCSFGSLMG